MKIDLNMLIAIVGVFTSTKAFQIDKMLGGLTLAIAIANILIFLNNIDVNLLTIAKELAK